MKDQFNIINQHLKNKILDLENTQSKLKHVIGKKILIGGAFDILHAGHSAVLKFAKQHGDILIVAIDSDGIVKARKGSNRPILDEGLRLENLCMINDVDFAFITNVSMYKPEVICKVNPDTLMRPIRNVPNGDEYRKGYIEEMRNLFPNLECIFYDEQKEAMKCSSTSIIDKILKLTSVDLSYSEEL